MKTILIVDASESDRRLMAGLLVKYGLEEISTILLRPTYTPKFDVFKFLSCRTFVRLNVFE